jgi:intermediate peptidase
LASLLQVLAQILSDKELRSALTPQSLAVAYVFLRDFEKSGIHLPEDQRARFVSLSDEILILGRTFLQDTSQVGADEVMEMPVEWLEGTPSTIVEALRKSCLDEDGTLTLRKNSWEMQSISKYAIDERARRMAHLGMNSGSQEQVGILEKLLQRRGELAHLTGNDSFASMTLGDKMARKPENVQGFLASLSTHHRPMAESSLNQLRSLKQQQENTRDFYAWDRDYYAEHFMRAMSRKSTTPPISGFFSVGSVFAGLSRLFERLYGISLRAAEVASGEVWAKDVCRMDVVEEGKVIGTIYADLYSRTGKPSSAAHYTVRCSRRTDDDDEANDFKYGRLDNGQIFTEQEGRELAKSLEVDSFASSDRPGRYQLPIVVLLCDFVRPTVMSGPSLLNWHEVETLFHEMGHAIHCECPIVHRLNGFVFS